MPLWRVATRTWRAMPAWSPTLASSSSAEWASTLMPCWHGAASAPRASSAGPVSIGASGDRISRAQSGQESAPTASRMAGFVASPRAAPSPSPRRGSASFENVAAGTWNSGALSIQPYSTVFAHLPPPLQLFAHERVVFLGRAADRADPLFLEPLGNDRIGVQPGDFMLNLADDRA